MQQAVSKMLNYFIKEGTENNEIRNDLCIFKAFNTNLIVKSIDSKGRIVEWG